MPMREIKTTMGQVRFLGIFRLSVLVAALAGAALLFSVACGSQGEVTPPSTTTSPANVVEGKQLYIDKGCAVCHGQDGEGTSIAPSLSGHNAEQTKRQVRSPLGTMPRSGPEDISDIELGKIIDYIESLDPLAAHIEPVAMEDALVIHHWMALNALESDNPDEAEHHVVHIIDIVVDPEHKSQVEDALADIRAGDYHDASHTIEEMIITKAEPGLTMKDLHLQLALASVSSQDGEDAIHHIERYIDEVTGHDKEHAQEALELLEQGNFHDAEHEIKELLE